MADKSHEKKEETFPIAFLMRMLAILHYDNSAALFCILIKVVGVAQWESIHFALKQSQIQSLATPVKNMRYWVI